MIQILDIDMDFFQSDIHTDDIDSSEFLEDDNISIWNNIDFENFLENQCCLSKNNKIKGKVVTHHVEAYTYWKQLIRENRLQKPFKVFHIDAHSDLGFSFSIKFYKFLQAIKKCSSNLCFERNECAKLINSGNYLLCAVIEGLISEIDYVYHDKLKELDVMTRDFECVSPNSIFRFKQNDEVYKNNVLLHAISRNYFKIDEPVDYITVAISPRFVKKEIGELIDIIKDYIDLE